jgi:hypothetical protein
VFFEILKTAKLKSFWLAFLLLHQSSCFFRKTTVIPLFWIKNRMFSGLPLVRLCWLFSFWLTISYSHVLSKCYFSMINDHFCPEKLIKGHTFINIHNILL